MSDENIIYPLKLPPEGFDPMLEMTNEELGGLMKELLKWRSGKPYTRPLGAMGFVFAAIAAAVEREDGRIRKARDNGGKGGSADSDRKAAAARENGLKGGRPRTAETQAKPKYNPSETQAKPKRNRTSNTNTNTKSNTKSNTNTVPLPFARAREDGNGDGNGDGLLIPGGSGSLVALARRFADAVKADRDNGGSAFFDPAHDPAAMMVALTGDAKSVRRWRQLAAGIPDADLRQELFTAYREITCGEEPQNRAAALNARLGKMLEASTHNGEKDPEAEVA